VRNVSCLVEDPFPECLVGLLLIEADERVSWRVRSWLAGGAEVFLQGSVRDEVSPVHVATEDRGHGPEVVRRAFM
jgi:hypothetical protein